MKTKTTTKATVTRAMAREFFLTLKIDKVCSKIIHSHDTYLREAISDSLHLLKKIEPQEVRHAKQLIKIQESKSGMTKEIRVEGKREVVVEQSTLGKLCTELAVSIHKTASVHNYLVEDMKERFLADIPIREYIKVRDKKNGSSIYQRHDVAGFYTHTRKGDGYKESGRRITLPRLEKEINLFPLDPYDIKYVLNSVKALFGTPQVCIIEADGTEHYYTLPLGDIVLEHYKKCYEETLSLLSRILGDEPIVRRIKNLGVDNFSDRDGL